LADTETGAPTKCGTVVAPAVNARAADPGDSTVKWPGPELPAATATDHIGLVEIVHGNREQVLNPVSAPAQAHVRDVEAVSVGRLGHSRYPRNGHSPHRPGRRCSCRAARAALRRDAVRDRDSAHRRRRVVVAADRPGDVRAVESIASAVNPRLGVLLLNTLAAMTFVVGESGIAEPRLCPVPRIVEQGCATSMPESTTATFTPSPALAAPPALFHASTALMIERSGPAIIG